MSEPYSDAIIDDLASAQRQLTAQAREIAALTKERDEARSKRDEWQREIATGRRLRTTHAAHAENGRVQIAALREALKPFVELADRRDDHYRKRGGNPDGFPDGHPSYDIKAETISLGVWRRARAALEMSGGVK